MGNMTCRYGLYDGFEVKVFKGGVNVMNVW